jgi:chromosome segregation ATPase
MGNSLHKIVIFMALFIVSWSSFVPDMIAQTIVAADWRERCRLLASGHFADLQDRLIRIQKINSQITSKLSKIDAEISVSNTSLDQTRLKIKKDNFDEQLEQRQQALDLQIKQLKKTKQQLGTLHQKNLTQNIELKENILEFEKEIQGLFSKVKSKRSTKKHQTYTLQYVSTCPQYRKSCTLPQENATQLKRVARILPRLEECRTYAHMRNTE